MLWIRRIGALAVLAIAVFAVWRLNTGSPEPGESGPEEVGAPRDRISTLPEPAEIAVDPSTNRVYVGHHGDGAITVIDGERPDHPILAELQVDYSIVGMAVDPDLQLLYVSKARSAGVAVFAIEQDVPRAVTELDVGEAPLGIVVDPESHRAYVACSGDDTVRVIDGSAQPPTLMATVKVGEHPAGVALDGTLQRAFVTNERSDDVTVLDIATPEPRVLSQEVVGATPLGIVADPETSHILVGNAFGRTMVLLDGSSSPPTPIGPPLEVDWQPLRMAFDPQTGQVLTTSHSEPALHSFEVAGRRLIDRARPIDAPGFGIAIAEELRLAFVASPEEGVVSVLPLDG